MRPKVICHMLGPLDGRLLVDGWAPSDGALYKALTKEYQRLHIGFAADAWLAGTTTMEEFARGDRAAKIEPAPTPQRPWHLADAAAKRFAIAIDRSARLHWSSATADDGHVVVVLSASMPDGHLVELASAGVSYLVMPSDEIDLSDMLAKLYDRLKLRSVLLEGGAKMNGAFLKAGLVDEVSLLLCPAIDGKSGGATIFETGDAGVAMQLELLSVQAVDAGAVHLLYSVRAPANKAKVTSA
jgi:riboflavin biosynthesis pyrimidine reductase